MYAGPLRLLRALTVSATCVALSLASHLVGAGSGVVAVSMVAGIGLLMTTILLTLVLMAVSGRRWTLGRSLVALGAGQVGLHAIFSLLLSWPHDHSTLGATGGASMALGHGAAALLVGVGIAVNDSALHTYFCITSSLAGSGIGVLSIIALSLWRLAGRIFGADAVSEVLAVEVERRSALWHRRRILTDLVVLQCLSRRGPPALALAS